MSTMAMLWSAEFLAYFFFSLFSMICWAIVELSLIACRNKISNIWAVWSNELEKSELFLANQAVFASIDSEIWNMNVDKWNKQNYNLLCCMHTSSLFCPCMPFDPITVHAVRVFAMHKHLIWMNERSPSRQLFCNLVAQVCTMLLKLCVFAHHSVISAE